ncbi:NACHT domain-containing protein [Nonomuraea zeae]|uniref:NACHT domain-containing protein n=1 Tax=Nonomuraea zeae TaxID=1642303 RepID=A0A5S4FWC4_9ACTN|nr:NACHT domain-containing protein [Nonomuraea zeae]TMR24963.1 NACHT domain-containing protein [Nonomuraea zeae]
MPGRRRTRTAAALAVAAVWTGLAGALLTNFATSGPLPEPFASSPWLTWLGLIASGIVSSVLVARMPAGGDDLSGQHGGPPEPRARSRALDDVRREALERLEIGLPPLRLRFREAADLVLAPVDDAGHRALRLRPEAEIVSAFDDLRGSMLLVGAPGAGKTTELHRLALALAERAEAEPAEPVPLVLSLASHSGSRGAAWRRRRLPMPSLRTLRQVIRRPLARLSRSAERDARPRPAEPPPLTAEDLTAWIARAARARYKVPAGVTKRWLADGAVVLLLDGLDEIPPEAREVMVGLVSELHANDAAPSVVVTCRSGEYAELTARLRLEGAVRIESLTIEEVRAYADAGDERFDALRALLRQDSDLGALVTTPLWLQIAADASSGGGAPGLPRRALPDDLLALYAQTMIASRPSAGMSPDRARSSLHRLASVDGEDDLRTVYRWVEPSPDAAALTLLHGLPWVGSAVAAAGLAWPLAPLLGLPTAGAMYVIAILILVGAAREIFARLPYTPGSPITGVRHLVAVHATGAALGVAAGGAIWLGQWALGALASAVPGPARWLLLSSALLVPSGWAIVTAETLVGRIWAGALLAGLVAACFLLPPVPAFYADLYAVMLVTVLAVLVIVVATMWLILPLIERKEQDGGSEPGADRRQDPLFSEAVDSHSILQNAVAKRIAVPAGAAGLAVFLLADVGAGADGGTVLRSIGVIALAAVWAAPIAVRLPAPLVVIISYLVVRVALPLGGWLPWRLMPILRFGAERDLLVVTLGQYRFRHPLIKEHFAGRAPLRATEDAAGYAADHRMLAARARDFLAQGPSPLGMTVAPQPPAPKPAPKPALSPAARRARQRAAEAAVKPAREPIPVADLPGRLRAETLLIGDADAGGDIVLAELGAALLAVGDAASQGGLPVVVDVRSWRPMPEWRRGAGEENPLFDWLAAHIADAHRIPHATAGRWLRAGRPVLLVRGLPALSEARRKPLLALFSELCERYSVRYVALSQAVVEGPDAYAILPLPGQVRAAYLTPELLAAAAGDTLLWDALIRPGWLLPIARGTGRHPSRYGLPAGFVARGLALSGRYPPVQALRSLARLARGPAPWASLTPVTADLVRRLCLPVVYLAVVVAGLVLPLSDRYGWMTAAAWTPVAVFAGWLVTASRCRPRLRAAVAAPSRRQRIGYGLAALPLGAAVGLMVAPLAQELALVVPSTIRRVAESFPEAVALVLGFSRTVFEALDWTDADISAWTGPDGRLLVMLLYAVLITDVGGLLATRLDVGARAVVRLLLVAATSLLFDGVSPAALTGVFWLGCAFGAAMTLPAVWLRLAADLAVGPPARPHVNSLASAGALVVPLLALAVERGLLPPVPDDLGRLLLGIPVGGLLGSAAAFLSAPAWLVVLRGASVPAPFLSGRFLAELRRAGLELENPLVHAFALRIDPDEGLPPPDGPDTAVRDALIADVQRGLADAPADPGLLRRFYAAGGALTLSGTRQDRRRALDSLGAELLRRAKADPTAPVPILLAPRAFPRTGPARRRVTSWVAGRLVTEHGMDQGAALRWLGEKRLALLIDLDGLGARTPARLSRDLWLVTECVTALDLPHVLSAGTSTLRLLPRPAGI